MQWFNLLVDQKVQGYSVVIRNCIIHQFSHSYLIITYKGAGGLKTPVCCSLHSLLSQCQPLSLIESQHEKLQNIFLPALPLVFFHHTTQAIQATSKTKSRSLLEKKRSPLRLSMECKYESVPKMFFHDVL